MMQFEDLLPPDKIKKALEERLVNRQAHPTAPLSIYNYSKIVQFSNSWDEVTEICRGLVVNDETGVVVARPFRKFGNYGQVKIPNHAMGSPPAVFEKLDGSCGISYEVDGQTLVATRGSFASDQAIWASSWLQEMFPGFRSPEGVTTLWEIVYPSNRIVVNYGDDAHLVLLGAVEIDTGADIPLWEIDWWEGERADHHSHIKDIQVAYNFANAREREATEGVVLAWYRPGEPTFRLKCKGVEYVRLHRLVTNCSTRTIWESLRSGESLKELIESVPDEFYDWVGQVVEELLDAYDALTVSTFHEFVNAYVKTWPGGIAELGTEEPEGFRKKFALEAKKATYPSLLFALLDGKDISANIWKLVEPAYGRPYVQEDV